ncbi:bifunctional pyr operon transcriptional regulator/uracil phosphoribosyltransferase PyrR [Hydrogenophaga sp. MI9]|uniref:bifunctional pyr operon transcriptional regulator/uracil phosphoribosyltransferase PyrR n=1 Tax=Hydrogenophaga sp. MI9 TaxID=3453719 RepID=UPI003EEFD132
MTQTIQLDAELLYAELREGVKGLIATMPQPVVLAGITSGGAWLAERLQRDLALPGDAGVISSSMHRDDFAQRGLSISAQTVLPYEVDGAHVVLIDDVLYTGRTLRAVINELFDYGRPASVQLAVLVDRGGRELPIQANVCAATMNLPRNQSLELARDADGRFRFVLETKEN